jgi:hypothetical protein
MELVLALPPSNTTDEAFLREVDEELRRDQALQLWRRWGRWIIAAVIVGLLAFAGMLLWNSHQDSVAGKKGEQLDQALDDLKTDRAKADAALKTLAASGGAGYGTMAKLAQAGEFAAKNDPRSAVAILSGIAGDSSVPRPVRDLATIRQTTLEYDSLKPAAVVDRLKQYAQPASPWFGSAAELVATAYLRQGKRDLAAALYGQLAKSEKVPPSIRQRAVQMASVLGIDATGGSGGQSGEKKAQ